MYNSDFQTTTPLSFLCSINAFDPGNHVYLDAVSTFAKRGNFWPHLEGHILTNVRLIGMIFTYLIQPFWTDISRRPFLFQFRHDVHSFFPNGLLDGGCHSDNGLQNLSFAPSLHEQLQIAAGR